MVSEKLGSHDYIYGRGGGVHVDEAYMMRGAFHLTTPDRVYSHGDILLERNWGRFGSSVQQLDVPESHYYYSKRQKVRVVYYN